MFDIQEALRELEMLEGPNGKRGGRQGAAKKGADARRKKAQKMFDDFRRKGAYVHVKLDGEELNCTGIRKVGEEYLELDLYCTNALSGGSISAKALIHKSQLRLSVYDRVKGGSPQSCPKTYAKFLKILAGD